MLFLAHGVGMGAGGSPVLTVATDRGKDAGHRPWWLDIEDYVPPKKRLEEKITSSLEERVEEAREDIKAITVEKKSLSGQLGSIQSAVKSLEKKAVAVGDMLEGQQIVSEYRILAGRMDKYEDRIRTIKHKERIRKDDDEVMQFLYKVL